MAFGSGLLACIGQPGPATANSMKQFDDWLYKIETDPVDHTTRIFALLKQGTYIFAIRCQGGRQSVAFHDKSGKFDQKVKHKMVLNFGTSEDIPVEFEAALPELLEAPLPSDNLPLVKAAEQIIVRVRTDQGDSKDVVFPSKGGQQAMTSFEEDCAKQARTGK